MTLYENKNQCCGCSACANVCAKNAISMVQDDCGFFYPAIDKDLCVDCGRCKQVCSFKNPDIPNGNQQYFLAKINDAESLKNSTSGGMFTAVSDVFLDNGGIVYSPVFDDEMVVTHSRITTKEQRDFARGSKYVQSNVRNIFKELEQDAKNNLKIVFFGSPCQVNAVKKLFDNKYGDRLFTVDVICNGVSSPLAWKKHTERIARKYNKKLYNYSFRPKTCGYLSVNEVCFFTDGTQKSIEYPTQKFNIWYHSGLVTRPSCSNCKYTNIKRVSDITIGDFSKAKVTFPEIDSSMGASTLIINTDKGNEMFNLLKDKVFFKQIRKEDCEQIRLKQCSAFNEESILFLHNCQKRGLSYASRRHFGMYKRFKMLAGYILCKLRKGK